MKSILDPSFRYRTSVDTNLRETFARIRREQRKQMRAQRAAPVAADLVFPRSLTSVPGDASANRQQAA